MVEAMVRGIDRGDKLAVLGVGSGQVTRTAGSTHELPMVGRGGSQATLFGEDSVVWVMVPEGTACGRPAKDEGLRGEVRRGMLSQSLSGSCMCTRPLVALGRG